MADLTFPRGSRLRKRVDFLRVQRHGRRVKTSHLVVCHLPREGQTRFGLTVSRKVGGAVVRNQVKRWLREALRHHPEQLDGVDVVLIARPSAARAGAARLRDDVRRALARIARRP